VEASQKTHLRRRRSRRRKEKHQVPGGEKRRKKKGRRKRSEEGSLDLPGGEKRTGREGERKNVETSVHRNQGSHLEDVKSITTGDLVNPIIRLLEVQVGAAHCRTPITLGGQQEKTKETPGEPNKSSSTTGRGGGAKGTQDASQSESQSRPLEAPRSPFEAEKTPCGKRG